MKREKTIRGLDGANGANRANRAYGSYRAYWLMGLIGLMSLMSLPALAQIKIGGNVYGGGNQGEVKGSTKVTVKAGDIGTRPTDADPEKSLTIPNGKVFGGARMANVGGNASVVIDGEHATDYIVINYVFGGNDIAGTIGTATVPDWVTPEDGVDETWNSFVHISSKTTTTGEGEAAVTAEAADAEKIYIGQVYAGGNGDYDYSSSTSDGKTTHNIYRRGDNSAPIASVTTVDGEVGFVEPEVKKAILDVHGGSIVYAYGGGNNVTVTEQTHIHVDNPSKVVNHILVNSEGIEGDAEAYEAYEAGLANGTYEPNKSYDISGKTYTDLLTSGRFKDMGINIGFSKPSSDEFQIGRLFGGNNKAEMAIQPKWNLLSGKIRNLYSGGNQGAMTSPVGLLLEIPETSSIIVDNVFGGCRMADVVPLKSGKLKPDDSDESFTPDYVALEDIQLPDPDYKFPPGLSARLQIRGGDINNVYGGNDITGSVRGGNAVDVYTSIRGDVYGGGNGAYPYTDNESFKAHEIYGDMYYEQGTHSTPIEALNDFRPNAEQVSIHLMGTEEHPTVIRGRVFCGGDCATLKTNIQNPLVELKMGSYVIAENVFLGNNGEDMINPDFLKVYAGIDYNNNNEAINFSSLNLKDPSVFSSYMMGAAMDLIPTLNFDKTPTDKANYISHSSSIGSLYLGGNVGSMTYEGKNSMTLDTPIIIYNKIVGGCNNANVPAGEYNAAYEGGIMGSLAERTQQGFEEEGKIKDRLELNFALHEGEGLEIKPMRLTESNTLEWNTVKWEDSFAAVPAGTVLTTGETYYTSNTGTGEFTAEGTEEANGSNYYYYAGDFVPTPAPADTYTGDATEEDLNRRLMGGNVYGGCYHSGHVNGNVVINLNNNLIKRNEVFANVSNDDDRSLYDHPDGFKYNITQANSGVILDEQGMDVLGPGLTVFGGGYGKDSEIWGSTTINLTKGYNFQVFGGSEQGVIGKSVGTTTKQDGYYEGKQYAFNGKLYEYNPKYSTTINLNGNSLGMPRGDDYGAADMAECEFIYGGGFEGPVVGDTKIYLGNGRLFNSWAGACNADVLGHGETYLGRGLNTSRVEVDGYPFVRDYTYGGSDLGGSILNLDKWKAPELNGTARQASSYTLYHKGYALGVFGGCYGDYDYTEARYKLRAGNHQPYMKNAVVDIRPVEDATLDKYYHLEKAFGGGQGAEGSNGDKMQDHSYVYVDIPGSMQNFTETEVFGAGKKNGMGMRYSPQETFAEGFDLGEVSAVIDLMGGQIGAAYGGSYEEGVTRRTEVNVPEGSTIKIGSIFGGAYGLDYKTPCDVYEANVNYNSADARLIYNPLRTDENTGQKVGNSKQTGSVYGGNNNERRTIYSKVNISSPVRTSHWKYGTSTGYIFGAGLGGNTWSEYTEVNLNPGAEVWEVYGGGQEGKVYNGESIMRYMENNSETIPYESWKLSDIYTDGSSYFSPTSASHDYTNNPWTNLSNQSLVTQADIDDRVPYDATSNPNGPKYPKTYNTNVLIREGATVNNYAYGGGLGNYAKVAGSTYIALLGGTVKKDIYAAGTSGAIQDSVECKNFIASANVYIKGGTCRNVYGGGWEGAVGKHNGEISASPAGDIPGETHVVIGDPDGTSFFSGIPAVQRNVYGGGEGAPVYGDSYVTLNKGYVGYDYDASRTDDGTTTDYDERYAEKIEDETHSVRPNTRLYDAGCIFGGGYVDNSSVDNTYVNIYGGHVRNSVFGGGEIAAIGRGAASITTSQGKTTHMLAGLYRPGKTNIKMYSGHVHRNVFGGGRGYNNLGERGTLNCDGYVFGQTEVSIHGGEIGTSSGLAQGNGNVFGGGDIGFVYSAYENEDGTFGKGVKSGVRYDGDKEGYYYQHAFADNGAFVDGYKLTEDCKVLIEPQCKVISDVEVNGTSYKAGELVPIDDLNTLKDKKTDSRWGSLDPFGIIIHNAVFAGGNTSSGSTSTYANATSVFGNATASVHDAYSRDLITLGTGHIGGLYGDGNMTMVDGYRELNITNYGTDYYSIDKEIDIKRYHALPEREAAYYELKYMCQKTCTDIENTTYYPASGDTKASTITAEDLLSLFLKLDETSNKYVSLQQDGEDVLIQNSDGEWKPNPEFWEENGVLPVYAGRLMNSIQRADFCGVWGSRMVMQGAQDRVPEVADYNLYTINRVREVSLNKKTNSEPEIITENNESVANPDYSEHGNYFGIYKIVNYLGALTSDVRFDQVRKTENSNTETYQCKAGEKEYGTATYYDWKEAFSKDNRRNNGSSHNKVALASGVYLELTTEQSTGTDLYEKDWGPITGIVELDLINVSPGVGGGFVYAKNEHGVRSASNLTNTTLTALNEGAATKRDYTYQTADTDRKEWETSGNFVHSTQTIVDDCYNVSGRYLTANFVPAHYWFIKGQIYVYDQYISAYTGNPNAFSETVDIPLTISAASHGKMELLNVQPNYYAYYSSPGVKLDKDKKIVINDKTYYQNDPISYWDYHLLSASERQLFKKETYTNCITCKIDGVEYEAGTYVMDDTEFTAFKGTSHTYTDADGKDILNADKKPADADYIFRLSNNLSHENGYILTYKVNNPDVWNTWYTKDNSASHEKNQTGGEDYEDGPTYHLNSETGSVLGQREYIIGDLVSENVYKTFEGKTINDSGIEVEAGTGIRSKVEATGQATFTRAYLVTKDFTLGEDNHMNTGAVISADAASGHTAETAPAYICTRTIQLSNAEYIYLNSKMTASEKNAYITSVTTDMENVRTGAGNMTAAEIKALEVGTGLTSEQKKNLTSLVSLRDELTYDIVPAYYCTAPGLYGGNYYEAGRNYRGLEAWSSMSATDRQKFTFNYDALDLFIDSEYGGTEGLKYQYDSEAATLEAAQANPAGYSLSKPIDYTATYHGGTDDVTDSENGKKYMVTESIINGGKVYVGDELTREQFESLPNEQRYYAPIAVKEAGTYYVVNTSFQIGPTPYAAGAIIEKSTYDLSDKTKVSVIEFDESDVNKIYYFCRESYTASNAVKSIKGDNTAGYNANETVPVGAVIAGENTEGYYGYESLPNKQKNFTIHGTAPTETSTLYVSRNSDIYDLSKEKIITVVYQYDYDETDNDGNVTPISERHVVNIHIQFKSGVPFVEDINQPEMVIPGDKISMREPVVTPGAYEITGGGWELFEKISDAESHINGVEYDPIHDPLYWYQHDWYVAYYAKTYLGRTYSNAVPVSVANYHDLAEVMSDANKEHHMYIDNPNVKREPKIYINDYTTDGKNGLDLFKNLFDLSLVPQTDANEDGNPDPIAEGTFAGHVPMNERVKAGSKLQFILRTDIDHSGSEWTSIGDTDNDDDPENDVCFQGNLHGDGHRLTGLNRSLFSKLCGNVYNLGVTGSFTGGGIAETGNGYAENCWVSTTGTPASGTTAIIGQCSDAAKQIENCYYLEDNNYSGPARAMSAKAFYNGEVTYDLNGFYLRKRYYDNNTSWTGTKVTYPYLTPNPDGSLPDEMSSGSYPTDYAFYPIGSEDVARRRGYVEQRFLDGDYRYAAGTIPTGDDIRMRTVTEKDEDNKEVEKVYFAPIWPDDYLFFGQSLNYNQVSGLIHQDVPSTINRGSGRVDLSESGNRVYRAPAYFQSKEMKTAHFNPYAVFAQSEKGNAARIAYKDMTAIDFSGHNDTRWGMGSVSDGSPVGFYPPLLDDGGLTGFRNIDLTRNLLAYTFAEGKTATTVDNALSEGDGYSESTEGYRNVSRSMASIQGHWVQQSAPGIYTATRDHLLMDKQDFNAPISYTFDDDMRMWYQRIPGDNEYVNRTQGWQGISLPFTAELVTTNQKGEITHFFSGSDESKDDNHAKIGHEYWLRELKDITDKEGAADTKVASFSYPDRDNSVTKTVTNTFLWDYYYKGVTGGHNQKDKNTDLYQTYYEKERTYEYYPLLTQAKPYLIGFPGSTYYEFDLSGSFHARNTAKEPVPLDKQVITFASKPGITIHVSDDEIAEAEAEATKNGFVFRPSYMNQQLAAGNYVMNTAGDAFNKLEDEETASLSAFRPYFQPASSGVKEFRAKARSILFSNVNAQMFGEQEDDITSTGQLFIRAAAGKVIVSSTLTEPKQVNIVTASGALVDRYTIQPGETRETPVTASGVYIVNQKKLSVKIKE